LFDNSPKASRAAQIPLAGHMQPVGGVFETPALIISYTWNKMRYVNKNSFSVVHLRVNENTAKMKINKK